MIVRGRCREVAEAQKLGQVRRVHRGVRSDWLVRLWEHKPWWPLPLLVACGMLAVLGLVTTLLLLALAAVALLAAVYLAPVTDPDGRLWVAVCDEGVVVARHREVVAAIRWKDVTVTLHWPPLVRVRYSEPLQFHEVRYAERYEIVGTSATGKDVTVVVDGVVRQRRLIRTVERSVTPEVLDRARHELSTTGRADFGPVRLTAAGDLTVHGSRQAIEAGGAAGGEAGTARSTVPARRLAWRGSHRQAQRSISDISATAGLPGFYPSVPRLPVSTALVKLGREVARDQPAAARSGARPSTRPSAPSDGARRT